MNCRLVWVLLRVRMKAAKLLRWLARWIEPSIWVGIDWAKPDSEYESLLDIPETEWKRMYLGDWSLMNRATMEGESVSRET